MIVSSKQKLVVIVLNKKKLRSVCFCKYFNLKGLEIV